MQTKYFIYIHTPFSVFTATTANENGNTFATEAQGFDCTTT
jgi:hypothetical protein